MNRTAVFTSSFALLAAAVVACSGDDASTNSAPVTTSTSSSSSSSSSGSGVTPVPTPAPTPAPTNEPVPVPVESDAGGGDLADAVAPPPAWSPADLGDLALWLRGDSLVHDLQGHISMWKDASGKGNDAQALKTGRPTQAAHGKHQGAHFDGSALLTIKDSPSLQWKEFTLFVIAASSQPKGSYGLVYGKSSNDAPFRGPALFSNYPLGPSQDDGAFGGQLDISHWVTTTSKLDDGNPQIITLERDGDTLFTYVGNGTTMASFSVAGVDDTGAVGVDAFIGMHPDAGQAFVGDIFEIIALPKACTFAERQQLWSYEVDAWSPGND